MTDQDHADDLALLVNTSAQAKFLLHCLEQAAGGIDLYVNANKCLCVLNKKGPSPLSLFCLFVFGLNGISTVLGYLMPNPSLQKNASGTN